MRYQNWDVLLFPQEGNDVKTPLQEFKTCCDVVEDMGSDHFASASNLAYYNAVTRPLPTVSCYVPSLVCGHAFRVSVHCWAPPEATRATVSLKMKDDIVVFEAKVLLDGVCVAGLVFPSDAQWPQIIGEEPQLSREGDVLLNNSLVTDGTTRKSLPVLANLEGAQSMDVDLKDRRPGPLRFPLFHNEMLSQAWVLPAQPMGRIKVMISEGISHGPPGITSFERTRNVVAFSFQHTPLHILEDSGIAWPNQGMFYQALNRDYNPLSPRRNNEADPDSHAHSPRHRVLEIPASAPASIDTIAPASSFTCGMRQMGMAMPPPPFRVPAHPGGNQIPADCNNHDPFIGIHEHAHRHDFLQHHTRQASSTGDVSMNDAPPKSRSTVDDQTMLDYSSIQDYPRAVSPVSSYQSYSMQNYSRPVSPESHHVPSLSKPPAPQPQSPSDIRQVSNESLRGPKMQRLFSEADAQVERGTPLPEESEFADLYDAMSPRKVAGTGYFAPANTRVSSAASTPSAARKPSAVPEVRVVSYPGKIRSVSNTTGEIPPPINDRAASETELKARARSRKSDSRQSEIGGEEPTPKPRKGARKIPSTQVRSRKENKSNDMGLEDATKSQHRDSAESALGLDKENLDILHPSSGDNKRRRISNIIQPGAVRADTSEVPPRQTSNAEGKLESPHKINEIDDLTSEGVVVRAPLGDLGNVM